MQKKIPLAFASAIMIVGLGLVVLSHGWLYSIFQKERVKEIARQILYTKKTIQVTSKKNLSLNTLIKNFHNDNIDEHFFILNKKLSVIYPKGGDIIFQKEKIMAKNFLSKWEHTEPFVFQKNLSHLDLFFKIEPREKLNPVYYVLLRRNILSKNIISFLILLYITIIILSLLVWFISYQFTNRFFSIIFAVTRSLKYYAQSQYVQMIDYDKKDEIGELIDAYNSLMEYMEISKIQYQTPQLATSPSSTSISTSTSSPQNTQEDSSPPKFDNIEIALFPKTSNDDNKVITVFQKGADHELHCLILETDENNQNAIAWKERLKDYFITLTQNNFEPKEIVMELLGSTRKSDNDNFRSNLFYGNFNTITSKMLLFKAGYFSLYTQDPSRKIDHLNIGSIDLSINFTALVEKEFKPDSYFFLFTHEFLRSFGITNFDLEENIFSSLTQNINSGRQYLIEVLQKLYNDSFTLSIGDKPLGNLLLLFHKK